MSELSIVTLCQALANITQNRCYLIENSNTCRCVDGVTDRKPIAVSTTAPDIMLSEVFLIFFVLILWLSAIGFCLNQYKSLRRLETQVHYCSNRKDPLNIGEIKIVAREQDSIIYKKSRYSTMVETHVNHNELKSMHYVKEYLPKVDAVASTIETNSVNEDNATSVAPIATNPPGFYIPSSSLAQTNYVPLSTHEELAEEQQSPTTPSSPTEPSLLSETDPNKLADSTSNTNRAAIASTASGLTVPNVLTSNPLPLSWDNSQVYEASRSAQHLSVPSNALRLNRHSDGNICLTVPQVLQKATSDNADEKLLDPKLIPSAVRRSLLALHRESQENIYLNMTRSKEKTPSETDVHVVPFLPWKIKMKSKLKRTHHQHHTRSIRPHSNTLSVLPIRQHSNDQERRISDYVKMNNEYRFTTPSSRSHPQTPYPTARRSLKYYHNYMTQSTTESETTQSDLPVIASFDLPNNDG